VAYDEDLADRVRAVLPPGEAMTERQMFGGLAFMLGGHMFCGVVMDTLMVRLGPEGAVRALSQPHVRPMDFTGRPMKGMVFVDPEGLHGERCGTGSTPPPATPAACRPSTPRPPASADDVAEGTRTPAWPGRA
jgi:hypothetical protein